MSVEREGEERWGRTGKMWRNWGEVSEEWESVEGREGL